MKRTRLSLLLFMLGTAMGISTGCSLKFAIDPPTVSHFNYKDVDKKPLTIKLTDQREDKMFSPGISGLKRVNIVLENMEDPVDWLSKELQKELLARGVPVQLVSKDVTAPADINLTINKFQVVNHRASGFSAWESYHLFLGKVTMEDKSCTIPAYFMNSKVPVWSMGELKEPCFNIPISAMVKDIASKINKCLFNYSVDNANLDKLVAMAMDNLKADPDQACLRMVELGSTNNPGADAPLKKIAAHDDSFVHSCAISALGTLGQADNLDFLTNMFTTLSNNDKIMPLKAIGDIGNSQAMDFLNKVKRDKFYEDENGARYVIDLYIAKQYGDKLSQQR